MFCTVCAAFNGDRPPVCTRCGASLRVVTQAARRQTGLPSTIAALIPVIVLLVALIAVAGRGWQQDRQRADEYRSAETALVDGRLLQARRGFAGLDGYRDASEQAALLDAIISPLEERTRSAEELNATGQGAAAIVELRDIVAQMPDLQEAVILLELTRRSLVAMTIAEADRHLAAGDVLAARNALEATLALDPTSTRIRERLAEVDARHPLLLMTRAGDVTVSEFDGAYQQRVIATGVDASAAVWSPDRSQAAFMSIPEANSDWAAQLWVVDANGVSKRMIAANAFRTGAPSWSPDGTRLIYVTADDFDWTIGRGWVGLRMVDLATGSVHDLTGRRFHFTTSVVWSPDGRQIAFVERHIYKVANTSTLDVRGGDLFLLDVNTRESRNLTQGRIREGWTVSWSPRGDQMLVMTDVDQWASADPNRLFRLDLATGALEELETRGIVTRYPIWSPDGSMFAFVQDDRVVRIWSDDGESWVRLPTNVEPTLSWAPDSSALIAPPKNVQDPTHVIFLGDELGRIDTIRVMFDNSYSSGGPPQWSPRTQPVVDEPLPSGTALD